MNHKLENSSAKLPNLTQFSKDWGNASQEKSCSQSFWVDLFSYFDISASRVRELFEYKVKILNNNKDLNNKTRQLFQYETSYKTGYIDLLWPGVLIIEQKSTGKDLNKAYKQCNQYILGLEDDKKPEYMIICDFQRFRFYNLKDDKNKCHEFNLEDLDNNSHLFNFIKDKNYKSYYKEYELNFKAIKSLSDLYDNIVQNNKGHLTDDDIYIYITRLVFIYFSDDSKIFSKDLFKRYIEEKKQQDDIGADIQKVFNILNTPKDKRLANTTDKLKKFPYINGNLFAKELPLIFITGSSIDGIYEQCGYNWSTISPTIFGSLFQNMSDKSLRRDLGMHYTTEYNILKVLEPLFLNDLNKEFKDIKNAPCKESQLKDFHNKIGRLTFLDPACGCGNFLIVAYKQLRLLEIEIYKEYTLINNRNDYLECEYEKLVKVKLENFYGLETQGHACEIAKLSLWLTDHQMNLQLSKIIDKTVLNIPLPNIYGIYKANAIKYDWNTIINKKEEQKNNTKKVDITFDYIIGNPPYHGMCVLNKEQQGDVKYLEDQYKIKNIKKLDYICGWFIKAASYMKDKKTKTAFVTTNSICQGQSVSILWKYLFNELDVEIYFAYKTFKWDNDAPKCAKVHVNIIGFRNSKVFKESKESKLKYIYDQGNKPRKVKYIGGYLNEHDIIIESKKEHIQKNHPKVNVGVVILDDGNLQLNKKEKQDLLNKNPELEPYIKRYISSRDFLYSKIRYVLYLKNAPPNILNILDIKKRLRKVQEFRSKSKRLGTYNKAKYPGIFIEDKIFTEKYIVVPKVTSEKRSYLPIGLLSSNEVVSNSLVFIPSSDLYYFGILSSRLHMIWTQFVAGRLENRIRYSQTVVYNNFPFLGNAKDKAKIRQLSQNILDIRNKTNYSNTTLAELYSPGSIRADLTKAHTKLDKQTYKIYGIRNEYQDNQNYIISRLFELHKDNL